MIRMSTDTILDLFKSLEDLNKRVDRLEGQSPNLQELASADLAALIRNMPKYSTLTREGSCSWCYGHGESVEVFCGVTPEEALVKGGVRFR